MKRANNLFPKLVSEENLRLAIFAVNVTHRFHPHHRPNRTVARVEADIDRYVKELREIITGGYEANEPRLARRWDKSAGKWRDISEPRLWPDQYVHHAVIQVLEPIMMRGMDNFCCGSIRNRGIHYGVRAIKKWMRTDPKGTKYAEELDIHHFYDSLTAETVMKRLRRLVKDRRMLEVCERLMKHGILIGAYFSQWFANTVLQPLDRLIRESGLCDHYLRYMDNFTLFGRNKRKLRRLRELEDCDFFIMAHKGVCAGREIGPLIDANQELVRRRAGEIRDLITEPMDFSQICRAVCTRFSLLTRRPRRALYYERNIRLFLEFLQDEGLLDVMSSRGISRFYRP